MERSLDLLNDKEVLVVCFDHNQISAEALGYIVKSHNQVLMPRDYVMLEDHPDAEETVNGLVMNFGKCGLLLVQRLSKLTSATVLLKEKGYYNTWSTENLTDVVSWRH